MRHRTRTNRLIQLDRSFMAIKNYIHGKRAMFKTVSDKCDVGRRPNCGNYTHKSVKFYAYLFETKHSDA
jgi:hypothetical protein